MSTRRTRAIRLAGLRLRVLLPVFIVAAALGGAVAGCSTGSAGSMEAQPTAVTGGAGPAAGAVSVPMGSMTMPTAEEVDGHLGRPPGVRQGPPGRLAGGLFLRAGEARCPAVAAVLLRLRRHPASQQPGLLLPAPRGQGHVLVRGACLVLRHLHQDREHGERHARAGPDDGADPGRRRLDVQRRRGARHRHADAARVTGPEAPREGVPAGPSGQRQADAEGGSAANAGAADRDGPTHRLHEGLADRQAQAAPPSLAGA